MSAMKVAGRAHSAAKLLARRGIRGLGQLVTNLYRQGEDWALNGKHAQYGLAVTRMLLGLTVLGMLATNWSTRLYTFGQGMSWSGQHLAPTSGFGDVWPASVMMEASKNDAMFTLLYLVLAAAAAAFIVGYRTKAALFVMFPLWVGLVETNELVSDQSDNLTRIIMIAMLFTAPGDRWSFDSLRRRRFAGQPGNAAMQLWRYQPVLPAWLTSMAHNLALVTMAAQVFFIYVSGGFYKAGGEPWSAGWAIYDPIHTVQFGTWPELSDLFTTWAPVVAALTYLTLLVQTGFPLMLMRRGTRIIALLVMVGFHLGIAVLMGLPWFSLAMIAVDSIFIRDITWKAMADGVVRAWRSTAEPSEQDEPEWDEPIVILEDSDAEAREPELVHTSSS